MANKTQREMSHSRSASYKEQVVSAVLASNCCLTLCYSCSPAGKCQRMGQWSFTVIAANFELSIFVHHIDDLEDLLRHWGKPFLEAEASRHPRHPRPPRPPRPPRKIGRCPKAMELLLSMIRIDPLSRPSVSARVPPPAFFAKMGQDIMEQR